MGDALKVNRVRIVISMSWMKSQREAAASRVECPFVFEGKMRLAVPGLLKDWEKLDSSRSANPSSLVPFRLSWGNEACLSGQAVRSLQDLF